MINDKADEVIKELFKLLKKDIKIFENWWNVVNLALIIYDGGSYIDFRDWLETKKEQ